MGLGIRKREFNGNYQVILSIPGSTNCGIFQGSTEQEAVDQAESYLRNNFARHYDNAVYHAKNRAKKLQERWGSKIEKTR
jgi:predicted secreted protein